MSTYVLVHGAWHGAWCWKKLTQLLESAGHRVFTPTLTGLGEGADLLSPDVGLSTHSAAVRALLERERLPDVVLVGHSYGGTVIPGTVERHPHRIGDLAHLYTS